MVYDVEDYATVDPNSLPPWKVWFGLVLSAQAHPSGLVTSCILIWTIDY